MMKQGLELMREATNCFTHSLIGASPSLRDSNSMIQLWGQHIENLEKCITVFNTCGRMDLLQVVDDVKRHEERLLDFGVVLTGSLVTVPHVAMFCLEVAAKVLGEVNAQAAVHYIQAGEEIIEAIKTYMLNNALSPLPAVDAYLTDMALDAGVTSRFVTRQYAG